MMPSNHANGKNGGGKGGLILEEGKNLLAMSDPTEKSQNFCKQMENMKNLYIAILIPILLLPIPLIYNTEEMKCAYVCLVTILYLITQALPLAVASLIPALMFPLFGILTMKSVSSKYFQDPIILFFASVVIARAIQSVNLHRRIALNLLLRSGSKPIWMVFGFMISTFFISMWINNSATAVLMTPVAGGVIEELAKLYEGGKGGQATGEQYPMRQTKLELEETEPDKSKHVEAGEDNLLHSDNNGGRVMEDVVNKEESSERQLGSLKKCIFIGIAYSCNIGGTASLTGTPPNLIATGILNVLFKTESELNFATWFFLCFPGALLILIFSWLAMCMYFFGIRSTVNQLCNRGARFQDPRPFIRKHLQKMGKLKQNEITVSLLFLILLVLWIFKNPKVIPGWQDLFKPGYVSDGTPALLIAILLFIIPSDLRCLRLPRCKPSASFVPYKPLLIWGEIQNSLMWDINLLFGGGLAMATGFSVSGLSKLLVKSFFVFHKLPKQLLLFIFYTITAMLTEVLNNIATTSIIAPIVAEIAASMGVNPIYFILPVTIAASFCFMLPIGTAPNAICFAAGKLNFWDMVKPGLLVHMICIAVIYTSINTLGVLVLHVDQFPAWASNYTTTASGNKTL